MTKEADPDVDPVKVTTGEEVGEYAVPDKDLEEIDWDDHGRWQYFHKF